MSFWVLAFAMASVGQPARAEAELDQIKNRAIEATRAATEAIPRAKGTGTFERRAIKLVKGEFQETDVARGAFTAAFSGGRDFVMFRFASPGPEYDARVFVDDGAAILGSVFSKRVARYGAEGYIYPRTDEGGQPDLYGPAPHYLARAWAFLDRIDELYKGATVTLEKEDGLHVIRLTSPKGYMTKFFIDPTKGYHVTRFESLKPDGQLRRRVEKDWAKTSGQLWYVRRILEQGFPRREGSSDISWKLEFSSFDPNVDIPEELFTVDALGLPVGSRIIDTRVSPNQIIIVKAPKTDVALLEKIVGQLPKTAVTVAAVPLSSQRLLWIWVSVGGLLLLVLGFGLARLMASRRKTG